MTQRWIKDIYLTYKENNPADINVSKSGLSVANFIFVTHCVSLIKLISVWLHWLHQAVLRTGLTDITNIPRWEKTSKWYQLTSEWHQFGWWENYKMTQITRIAKSFGFLVHTMQSMIKMFCCLDRKVWSHLLTSEAWYWTYLNELAGLYWVTLNS